jgi:hypothetical protein
LAEGLRREIRYEGLWKEIRYEGHKCADDDVRIKEDVIRRRLPLDPRAKFAQEEPFITGTMFGLKF